MHIQCHYQFFLRRNKRCWCQDHKLQRILHPTRIELLLFLDMHNLLQKSWIHVYKLTPTLRAGGCASQSSKKLSITTYTISLKTTITIENSSFEGDFVWFQREDWIQFNPNNSGHFSGYEILPTLTFWTNLKNYDDSLFISKEHLLYQFIIIIELICWVVSITFDF